MEKNEEILSQVFDKHKRPAQRFVLVKIGELAGWEGSLPTQVFLKFERHWVCYVPLFHSYKIVRIESWMMNKSEKKVDSNAPLPVSGVPKFNLKDLYKEQIRTGDKPKELKDEG